jgi:Fic family protein
MKYNWQQTDWPEFKYDLSKVEEALYLFAEQMGRLTGVLKTLPEDTQLEAIIDAMVSEAIKTSEIEGEYFSRKDVQSSIRNRLGLNTTLEKVQDKKANGAGELMVDVRNSYAEPLSTQKLFQWHKMLLPDSSGIQVGNWRSHEEPMQVISGTIGKEKVHFEAPPSHRVAQEMERFIAWFNATAPRKKPELKNAPIRAAIAHLYFETIHPFEDGNGRIGRALSEKALSQNVGRPVLLSFSQTIEANKKQYYAALQKAQIGNEITSWIIYFVNTIIDAQKRAEQNIDFVLYKTLFFDRHKIHLNDRQAKVVKRMLDAGPQGFEGGMNASKYASITKISKATATRDLQELVVMGAITSIGGGRSTRYVLVLQTS